MSKLQTEVQPLHRITCAVHDHLHHRVMKLCTELGIMSVIMETGRSVRQERRRRPRLFAARGLSLSNSPVNIYQFVVVPADSETVVRRFLHDLQLTVPGRGTIFSQTVYEHSPAADSPGINATKHEPVREVLLHNLALITCILSTNGAGEGLAGSALELGTGVPLVTLGYGTGMRDRLGLLRITVSPEKELVHLLVPSLDAQGIIRLLVEEGGLNRPGKGFVYCVPVDYGRLDTSLQIGYQDHQASFEQVIAAIDEIKADTAWRRRFPDIDSDAGFLLQRERIEITIICPEEHSGTFVMAAMDGGAGGATTARIRQLSLEDSRGRASERCILTVPKSAAASVIRFVLDCADSRSIPLYSLSTQSAPFSFSYR